MLGVWEVGAGSGFFGLGLHVACLSHPMALMEMPKPGPSKSPKRYSCSLRVHFQGDPEGREVPYPKALHCKI